MSQEFTTFAVGEMKDTETRVLLRPSHGVNKKMCPILADKTH